MASLKFKYDDPIGLVAGSVVMEMVAGLCVGLRFYLKYTKRSKLIMSDWLILAALILGTGLTAMELYGIAEKSLGYPLGSTILDPATVERATTAKHIELAFLMIGILAIGLIKLSVCFFYWHLFARVVYRTFLRIWMVIISLWTVAFILCAVFQCGSHFEAFFNSNPKIIAQYCVGPQMIPPMAISDVITDFITLLIPVPVILGMRMSLSTKVFTILLFMIGALSVGASIGKAYIYINATLHFYTEDGILILTGLSIWNLVEVQVGIVAACGPTLRPIFSGLFPQSTMKSLASFLGFSSTKSSEHLPTFVKIPSSPMSPPQTPCTGREGKLRNNNEMDYEDLEFCTDATKMVAGHH